MFFFSGFLSRLFLPFNFQSFKMIFEQCAVAHNRSSWIREYDCRLSVSTHCVLCFAFSHCFYWCCWCYCCCRRRCRRHRCCCRRCRLAISCVRILQLCVYMELLCAPQPSSNITHNSHSISHLAVYRSQPFTQFLFTILTHGLRALCVYSSRNRCNSAKHGGPTVKQKYIHIDTPRHT